MHCHAKGSCCIQSCPPCDPCNLQVATQEGLRSLWKGNLATILHRIPYSAVNFSTFEAAKRELEARQTFSGTAGGGEVARRFVAGAASGLVACTAVSGSGAGRLHGVLKLH